MSQELSFDALEVALALQAFMPPIQSQAYSGYVPITPVNLTDTGTNVWGGSYNAATGTYTFDLQAAANGLPSGIKAVVILLSGQWAAAANTSTAGARPRGGSVNHLITRALAAAINADHQGIVQVDTTYFDVDVVIAGATMNNAVCRALGYFI